MTFLHRGQLRFTGRRVEQFLEKAEAAASGGQSWAIVAVRLTGLQRLSAEKIRGAMESMRLYLESAVGDGEFFERIGPGEYGLMFRHGDEAAFERRLEILRQDTRYLYMAAYPGQNICACVAACRVPDAPGAAEALKLAQERNEA